MYQITVLPCYLSIMGPGVDLFIYGSTLFFRHLVKNAYRPLSAKKCLLRLASAQRYCIKKIVSSLSEKAW